MIFSRALLTTIKALGIERDLSIGSDPRMSWRAAVYSLIMLMALVLVTLLGKPTQAQLMLGPAWESNITLTQRDLDLIHRTVDAEVHGKPVGTTASWSNPETGNAGTVKLLRKFRKGNLACEEVGYTLTNTRKAVEPEHYVFDSCLTPEGWRIARYLDEQYPLNRSTRKVIGTAAAVFQG